MTKTLNQIFFFLHQNQNIFFSIIFRKKTITPLPFKLNGRSLMMFFFTCFWVNLWTAHFYQLGALLLRKGVTCHSPILQLFSASSSFVFFIYFVFIQLYMYLFGYDFNNLKQRQAEYFFFIELWFGSEHASADSHVIFSW